MTKKDRSKTKYIWQIYYYFYIIIIENLPTSTPPKGEKVKWYQIPRHEFLRATEATSTLEWVKVVGRIAIREASQLVVSNLSDKMETIMLGAGMYSVYHFADINKIHTLHDVFDNPLRTIGVAILVGSTGRLIFLWLTKPIIKSIANTRAKAKQALTRIAPGDED